MTANNLHISQDFIKAVLSGHALADVSTLAFRDPATFVAGSIHSHFSAWEQISNVAPYELTPKIFRWIKNRIDVQEFFNVLKDNTKEKISIRLSLPKKFSPILFHVSLTPDLSRILLWPV